MASVCFYFQIHQPFRLRRYSVFDAERDYFDDPKDAEIVRDVARRCYLPANQVLLETIRKHEGKFRVAFSVTGVALEQFQAFAPEVIETLQALAATGCVEFLAETYFHSLAFLYSRDEFRTQVEMHRLKVKELFGQEPRVFRNTELIYSNDLGHFISHMGFSAVLADSADHTLGTQSPNYVHSPPHAPQLKLLLKNDRLSDDIAYRFSDRSWTQWPLTADKFAHWVSQIHGHGYICNLFLDYQAFGGQHSADSGIFDFLRHLPIAVLSASRDNSFLTPGEVADRFQPVSEIDVPNPTSWSEAEHDLSPWIGNAMQTNALNELYKIEGPLKEKGDERLLTDWRRLTSSDHFLYMSTKHWTDEQLLVYFSPYESPYDGYINFMNVLDNIQSRM